MQRRPPSVAGYQYHHYFRKNLIHIISFIKFFRCQCAVLIAGHIKLKRAVLFGIRGGVQTKTRTLLFPVLPDLYLLEDGNGK